MGRLLRLAEQEKTALFKVMPTEFKTRIEGVTLCFQDRPTKAMLAQGAKPETTSITDRDARTITLFLMNFRDRFGRFPSDIRQNVRRAIVQELADWAGLEIDWEDSL
jgi:hypothetical protein